MTHELKPYERVLDRMNREAITVEVVPEATVIDGEVIEYTAFPTGNGSTP